jgi:hypothetical protein
MKKSFTEIKNYNKSVSLLKRNLIIQENVDNLDIECPFDERKLIKITDNPPVMVYFDRLQELRKLQDKNFSVFSNKSFAKKLEFPMLSEVVDNHGAIVWLVVTGFVEDASTGFDFEGFYFEEFDPKVSYSLAYDSKKKSSMFPYGETHFKQIHCFIKCSQIVSLLPEPDNSNLMVD